MTAMAGAGRSTRQILVAAAPIAIAVFVFGISFGVLAVATRIPAWAVILMSILVFAGSAQFAAVGVIAAGGGVVSAVLTGALLNVRYLATGIASARSLPGGRWRRALLGQLIVDESFAMGVAAGEGGRPERRTLLVTGALLYSVWIAGTLLGTLVGPVLGDPKRLGLDAAFPALFTALLWPMLAGHHAVRCAIGGALAALLLAPFAPPGIPLAAAALVGFWLSR
jgi:4-azaleucine resistance transporter AzlC